MLPKVTTDGIRYWLELDSGREYGIDWYPESAAGPGQSGHVANISAIGEDGPDEERALAELAADLDCSAEDDAYDWLAERLVELWEDSADERRYGSLI